MKIGFLLFFCLGLIGFSSSAKALDNQYTYSLEELSDGVYMNEDMFFVNDGFDYQLNDMVIGDGCYLIVGEYKNNEFAQTRFIDSFPYLAFYKDNVLKWRIKTDYYGYGKFESGIFFDDKIIVVGTFESEQQITQIGIFVLNYNGDIINYTITKGNDNSNCERVYSFDDTLYVTGETMATNLGYGDVQRINHILVMAYTLDLHNFNNLYISNDQDSKLFQSFYSGNTIAIFGKVSGEGYFNVSEDKSMICMISERLDIDMYKEVDQDEKDIVVAVKDEILFLNNNGDPSKVNVTTYGYALNEVKEQHLNLGLNIYEIESFKANYSVNDDKIIIGFTASNNKVFYDFIILLDEDLDIIYNIEIEKKEESLLKFCDYVDGDLYSFGIYDDGLYGRKIIEVKLENNQCYFNGVMGEKIVKQIDENVFGIYQIPIQFMYKDLVINSTDELLIPPTCSIKDKGVYEKGFELTFNGEGYLNGIKIENGHQVLENGSYLLEVVGKSESVYYSFVVKDLSLKEININNQDVVIKEIIDNQNIQNNDLNYNLNFEVDNSKDSIFIVLLFIIGGLVLGAIIPIERIGRKNA